MPRHFKTARFGPALLEASGQPGFFDQIHVIFGGTGAVGGATALRLLDCFEETLRFRKPEGHKLRIVITGLKRGDIRDFTTRLFHIHNRENGAYPKMIKGIGCRTQSGILVRMETFSVEPAIAEVNQGARVGYGKAADSFLTRTGLHGDAAVDAKYQALRNAIGEIDVGPFTRFLQSLRDDSAFMDPNERFRSVVVGIPLPSVATYHSDALVHFARALGIEEETKLKELKKDYLAEFPQDLGEVFRTLADEVLVAHTTGVGGMYDEDIEGNRTIRLGFAHSALGQKLLDKQEFASTLTRQYAALQIKMLVTAAAIGIDEILLDQSPVLKGDLARRLQAAADSGFEVIATEDLRRKSMHYYPPCFIDLYNPEHQPVALGAGKPIVCDYVIRSGENGFFSVANADALYRIMGVASDTELGFVLARTALLGDDLQYPQFRNNINYYNETDYSRQVFDLLGQPALLANQISGLQPKALQDLGSSKHQGELHMLGLLILLHRLQTLNLLSIKSKLDLEHFDAADYFEEHSQPLMLEDLVHWDAFSLAEDLGALVTARNVSDLKIFQNVSPRFPDRRLALEAILERVLQAVWTIPSLGTPILFEEDGKERIAAGFYIAPIDRVITHQDSIFTALRQSFRDKPGPQDDEEFVRYMEFHIANNGFADLRPRATLVTCTHANQPLEGKVQVFDNEKDFLTALGEVQPYAYFTCSGLIAQLVRLRAVARHAARLDLAIGTANDFRAHFIHDKSGHAPLIPGVIEAFRMFSEGLEKNTGAERLGGLWGYR